MASRCKEKGGFSQALGYLARVVITFPRNFTLQLVDSALLRDEQTLVVLEHLNQPRVMLQKLCSQPGQSGSLHDSNGPIAK